MTSDKKTTWPHFAIDFEKKWELLREIYDAGVDAALYDALQLAYESGRVPPDWVFGAALEIIGNHLKIGISTGDGPAGNTASKYKYEMQRFWRWHKVKIFNETGMTLNAAFNAAIKTLEGTFAKGGYDTMRKSYYRVKKELKDPNTAIQHYIAMHDAQVMSETAPYVKV